MYGFLRRKALSLRQITTFVTKKACKQPSNLSLEEKIQSFQNYVSKLKQEHCYQPSFVINMDETPVWFNMPARSTVDVKGTKRVPLLQSVNNKHRVTVVLACASDIRIDGSMGPVAIFT